MGCDAAGQGDRQPVRIGGRRRGDLGTVDATDSPERGIEIDNRQGPACAAFQHQIGPGQVDPIGQDRQGQHHRVLPGQVCDGAVPIDL